MCDYQMEEELLNRAGYSFVNDWGYDVRRDCIRDILYMCEDVWEYKKRSGNRSDFVVRDDWNNILLSYFNLNQMAVVRRDTVPLQLLAKEPPGIEVEYINPESPTECKEVKWESSCDYIAVFKLTISNSLYNILAKFETDEAYAYRVKTVTIKEMNGEGKAYILDANEKYAQKYTLDIFYGDVLLALEQEDVNIIGFINTLQERYLVFNEKKFRVANYLISGLEQTDRG